MHGQVPASRKGSVLRFIVGTFVLLLVLAVCGGLIWFNFFRDKMIAQFFAHFPVPTITVSTVEVSPQKWTPGIDAVGTLAAAQGVEVAGQVGGVVKAVNFKGNDKVAAGAVLVQIDDSVELAGLTAAESTVAVNQDALDRTQMLFTRKVATSADLQTAQNKLALAQGVTEQIHARVAQKAIVAPFAGVTGIPKVVVGQYIEAGKPVATLQDLSRMRVDFTIPEQQLADLWIDEPVSIGLTRGPSRLQGRDHRHRSEDRSPVAPGRRPGGRRQCQWRAPAGPVRPRARPPPRGAERDRAAADGRGDEPLRQLRLPGRRGTAAAAAARRTARGRPGRRRAGSAAGPGRPAVHRQADLRRDRPALRYPDRGRQGRRARHADRVVRPEQAVQRQPRHGRQQRQPGERDHRGRIEMSFSEIFIRRPVLSTVVSFMILLLGAQGIASMSIRQYPKVDETVITVTTAYPGAASDVIQGFITSTIAKAVSSAEGVDYVTSKSALGLSTVSVFMRLNADPDKSLTEVIAKVQQVRGQLPSDAKDPVIQKGTGFNFALMYLAARSDTMNPQQLTEYLTRVIQPRFATVDGVADAQILGAQQFAMRVWIDPVELAARMVTATDVLTAITRSNFLSAPGKTKNEYYAYSIEAKTTLQDPETFGELPVRANGDDVVRLRDVAKIELGAASADVRVQFNGTRRRLPRHLPDAGSQSARGRPRGPQRAAGDPGRHPRGHADHPPLRFDPGDQRLDRRGVQDDRRGGGDRRPHHPSLPRLVPFGRRPDRHHPAVADRRLLHDVGGRLFAEHADPPRHGARHRPRRRRRDRRRREHPPPYRGGLHAALGGGAGACAS